MNDERQGWTSASNAEADLLCPGRHIQQKVAQMERLMQGIPEQETDDAKFGRSVHRALAAGSPDGLSVVEGEVFDECQEIEKQLVEDFFGEEVKGRTPKPIIETRLWIQWDGLAHSGQPDAIHRLGLRALILERKSLWSEAPKAPSNLQLRDQAVLVYHNAPMISEIGVAVVQPRISKRPEICLYTEAELHRAAAELFERVKASNNPESLRIAGAVQCKFCRGKTVCAEYQSYAGRLVPGMGDIIGLPVSQWSPQQRAVFCDRFDVAQRWLNETWDALVSLEKLQPGSVEGYEIKEGAKREVIQDPQAVFERFAAKGGTSEQFMQCVNITKAKVKELMAKLTGKRGQGLEAEMKALTDGLTKQAQNMPSLVKRKDP